MNIDVAMPQLGETVSEGTVTRWLRQVGDEVTDQEPLLEIATDKVDTEVPSPGSGTLLEILVPEDATVSVGTVLAVIGPASRAAMPAPNPGAGEGSGSAETADPAPTAAMPATNATSNQREPRQRHSPRVRKLAAEAGLSPDALRGTGPQGRVTPQDVALAVARDQLAVAPVPERPLHAAPSAGQADLSMPQGAGEAMSSTRLVIADRMMKSLHGSAQLTTVVEVDVTRVVEQRAAAAPSLHERLGVRLTLTAYFARAALDALRAVPVLNASIGSDGSSIVHHAAHHLGIAVDTERGLMVPVVKDAGDLNLLGLSRRIGEVATRARSGNARPDDLAGGTFTLTNTGSRGALFDTPILVPGQVGILGTGAAVERPAVVRLADGERVIAIRSLVHLALTYDHRLVDGADAARFLVVMKDRLEAGQFHHELA